MAVLYALPLHTASIPTQDEQKAQGRKSQERGRSRSRRIIDGPAISWARWALAITSA